MEIEEGGKEPYIILGYREDELGDCSLGETLDSLVPLLREVNTMLPIPTYQGRNVIKLLGTSELVG